MTIRVKTDYKNSYQLAPNELILKLKKDHGRYLEELNERLDKIEFTADYDPVWNISNPKTTLETAQHLIEGAKNKIYIGIWDAELEQLLPSLREADSRGVETILLIYGNAQPDFGTIFYHVTSGIKGTEELGRIPPISRSE